MSGLMEFWLTEGPRRAQEEGGVITLTKREYDNLWAAHGGHFDRLLGFPLKIAGPYDWQSDPELAR